RSATRASRRVVDDYCRRPSVSLGCPWIQSRGTVSSLYAAEQRRQVPDMRHPLSRRAFITSATAVTGSLIAAELRAAVPPKETGLSSEGLLAGRAGFQPRTVMPLP